MRDRATERSTARVMIVVARDRRDLYEYFEHHFEGIEDITVILDRRTKPRSVPPASAPGPDLRERQDFSDELKQRGFVIIHLW